MDDDADTPSKRPTETQSKTPSEAPPPATWRRIVEDWEIDLAPEAFACLKQIRMHGKALNRTAAQRLLANDLVTEINGYMLLTSRGRRALLRGSPALWASVA